MKDNSFFHTRADAFNALADMREQLQIVQDERDADRAKYWTWVKTLLISNATLLILLIISITYILRAIQ